MFRTLLPGCLLVVLSLPTSAAEPAAIIEEGEVRATIEKSLPFIQREGVNWIDKRKCVSCHQVPFMVWSLNAASARGFNVDAKQLKRWNAWAIEWKHFSAPANRDKQNEVETVKRNVDTIYQLLLANQTTTLDDSAELKLSTFANRLIASQQEDGSWKPCGQLPLQNRQIRETADVSTMWTLIALKATDVEASGWKEKRQLATKWLAGGNEGQSTEWWAVRLLLKASSKDGRLAEAARDKLIAYQRDDGGWGWLTTDESDALGSGIALYALCRAGLPPNDPSITKARQFLVTSQRENGSWSVNGTKTKTAKRVTKTATYWGTCWAVIGLLESMGQNSASAELAN